MTQNDRSLLAVSATLILVGAVIIYVISLKSIGNGIDGVLVLVLGMISASVFSALSKYYDRSLATNREPLRFDDSYTKIAVEQIIDADFKDVRQAEGNDLRFGETPYDLLISQDPVLALAKLRIDLEREVRRAASENGMNLDSQKISLRTLIGVLSSKKVIDTRIVTALEDIIKVCNSAIHGAGVTAEIASNITDIGTDLLRILKAHNNKAPNNSVKLTNN
ncbi:hypothetical protein [Methylobacterium sp. Leaf86]|uniref:hypothetical protein n=1 Tax=Methylobacterium sp. Leaf86 TaxID=1736242 RepID=UPI000AB8AC47|nr:hypothetical protein [Methylobacterium sp. Leaf86]